MLSRFLVRTIAAGLVVVACSGATPIGPTGPLPGGNASPPASAGHSLVYAPDREMVLLVNAGLGGGGGSSPPSTSVWGWTGTEWQLLDATGPPARNLAGVAYDTRRSTLVIHGGTNDAGRSYGETWEWSRSGWRQFTGANPGLRDHTQMAYDEERGRAVLFGGSGADPNVAFADTWEFDGTQWQQAATSGPAARIHHAMQYDRGLRRVIAFGGVTPQGGGDLGDTWVWSGSAWTALGSSTTPRTHSRMAFHRRLNGMLAAGGFGVTSGLGVLIRRDSGWSPLASGVEPGSRYLTDVAYDARRDVLVLFGGGDANGMSLFADTWEFDGVTWRRILER